MVRSQLVALQNHGAAVPLQLSGSAFVLCPLAVLGAGAPVGEAGQLIAAAAALVLLATGLTGLRQLATGLGLPILITAVMIIGITSQVVGTLFPISGVAIAVPLLAAIGVVLYASRWRAGDLSLVGLALSLGFALAYVLDNIVHDDNGSATDQAALVLLPASIALALWALARTRSISNAARICVVLGAVLGLAVLILALATGDPINAALAAPAGSLLAFGLAATGISLIRLGQGSATTPSKASAVTDPRAWSP